MRMLAGRMALAAVVAAVLGTGMSPAVAAVMPHTFVPPRVQRVPVLSRVPAASPAAGQQARDRVSAAVAAASKSTGARPDSSWPTAGTATVTLPAISGLVSTAAQRRSADRPAKAVGLPVTVARAGTGADALSRVQVRVLSHRQALEAGVSAVLMTVSAPGATAGPLRVSLGYASFRNAGSAGFADRLRLVELPACALTTPQVPACQVQTMLPTVNDASSQTVSASGGPFPASAAPAPVYAAAGAPQASPAVTSSQLVIAAVAGSSGSNGDFTATSLKPSGTWSAGGSSGDFTWSYPATLPPSAGGAAPKLALGYDSASVDGKTAQTNDQSSEVGEGFALDNNYIERSYADCADDPEGAISGKYDQCWAGNVVTLSLNGTSTQLVDDSSSGWHEENDSGDRIQYEKGTGTDTGNGTYDNDYWVVTTTDGTQYFFGKNKGPGWASGDPVTNSAWTVPVYGAHSGDPCYSSSGFGDSSCAQAWRWNLDFVIDPDGNASTYYYAAETNYYGANGGTTGVKYTRGGYLTKIDYGLRDDGGSVYSSSDTNAPDQVTFHADQRCIATSTFSCSASDFTTANASHWPDTPVDQMCTVSQTCNNHAPTFWSQMRIDAITTRYWNGSAYVTVDKYALGQSFPSSGDPELELNTITRTGYSASGSSVTLPPVDLTYQLMNNRIPGYNDEPDMAHWRMTNIETETGEIIDVTYSASCTSSDIPSSPSSNTTLCYPIYWTPTGNTSPILDYFNKYVVREVAVQDGLSTDPDPSRVTKYQYVGNPAWHYDDNRVVKAKYRTYGQFRGYGTVKELTGDPQHTTNGTPDVQTETDTTFYRGLYGDTLPGGGTSTTQVSDSLGDKLNDYSALAGQPLEVQTFDGSGGAQLTDDITERAVTKVTGTESVSGLPDLQASMTGVTSERHFTDLSGGGQDELATTTTYDSAGRPVLTDKTGTGIPGTCTQTSYADNTGAWIRDLVSEVVVAAQTCPSAPGSLTGTDVVSDTRTYYDGSTSLTAAPSAGKPTKETKAVTNSSGTLTFATQWTKAYDALGRVTASTDGRGNLTTTAYTPAGNGPPTKTQVTNALSQTSTTTLDPSRGSVLTSTDVAGYETSASYDPLGRTTAVWNPGRSQSGGDSANVTYSYKVNPGQPLAVTTNTLVDTGPATDYVTSISLYDSLGDLRQTQAAAEGGNTAVTDKFYDSHGWVWETYNKYVVSGGPATTLVQEADSAVNDRTVDSYDGAGRITHQRDYNGDTQTDFTQTVYGGDQVTTIRHDAAGHDVGTPSATVTDALGQQTQTIQYKSPPTVSGSVVSGGSPQVTTTAYDAMGDKAHVTGPDGSAWTYAYNLLGEQTTATDADSGTTVTGYDAAGNVAYKTDADGTSVNDVYDTLNRKTAEYTGSTTQGSGTQDAAWIWDTLKKGRLSYEKSVTASGTYESGNLGYDLEGDVSGTWVNIPSGQPLAGTYETKYAYSTTGLLLTELPASGGGLPADVLAFSYDNYGNPVKEQGYDVYVSGATWTPYGEISQINLGTGPSAAALTYSYDPQTRNVTGINMSDDQPSPQVDDTAYAYNADQQVTKITDTEGASGSASTETQCLGYDGLSRLTQAWTSSDSCADDPSADGNSTVTGPQPYWQSWMFDAAGDILSRTDHATAGSSAGDTTATYGYGTSGHAHAVSSITSVNSVTGGSSTTGYGYDADGNTTTLGDQSLAWNPGGTLKSADDTSYVYDADGNEMAETGPSGTTLYLPGEQLTQAPGGAVTGIRYYTFAGTIIGEGTSADLWWTEQSTQGTLTAAVDAGNEAAPVIRRTLTPYGTPVTGDGDGTWPDDRTFLNDPYHSSTGLVDIGARKYDPATGLFISVDPVLDTDSPQTMNGYVYGAGDPVNNTDPSGEMIDYGDGVIGGTAPSKTMEHHYQAVHAAHVHALVSAVEDHQLEYCRCRMSTMQAVIRAYHNPVYAQQRVSSYMATLRYDAKIRQQSRQRSSGCGFLGIGCATHWVEHSTHWVEHNWQHYTLIGANLLSDISTVTGAFAGVFALFPGLQEVAGALGAVSLATGAASAGAYLLARDKKDAAGALAGSVVGMLTGGLGKPVGKALGGALARAVSKAGGSGEGVQDLIEGGGASLVQRALKAPGTTKGTKIAATIGQGEYTAILNIPGIAGMVQLGDPLNAQ